MGQMSKVKIVPAGSAKRRGRTRTVNSERQNLAILKLRLGIGVRDGLPMSYQAIADRYNNEKRRQIAGKTFKPQAVNQRVKDFAQRNQSIVLDLLKIAPEPALALEAIQTYILPGTFVAPASTAGLTVEAEAEVPVAA